MTSCPKLYNNRPMKRTQTWVIEDLGLILSSVKGHLFVYCLRVWVDMCLNNMLLKYDMPRALCVICCVYGICFDIKLQI